MTKAPVLKDAQGCHIPVPQVRELRIILEDMTGNPVVVKDKFAIAAVSTPLLAVGSMVRAGWSVVAGGSNPNLQLGDVEVPIHFQRNSLAVRGRVCQVRAEGAHRIRIGQELNLKPEWENLVKSPGWHILASGIPMLVSHVTRRFQDPSIMFNHEYWPARMTVVEVNPGEWRILENVADYMDQAHPFCVIPELPGNGAKQYKTVLTFLGTAEFDETFLSDAGPEDEQVQEHQQPWDEPELEAIPV